MKIEIELDDNEIRRVMQCAAVQQLNQGYSRGYVQDAMIAAVNLALSKLDLSAEASNLAPAVLRRAISEESARQVRKMLRKGEPVIVAAVQAEAETLFRKGDVK